MADQVTLQNLPDLPRDHRILRELVIQRMPSLPQFEEWKARVEETGEAIEDFLDRHKRPGEWTDNQGIICQATALAVGREIRLVGTANIGQMPGYTTIESLPGSERLKPLSVGYYQNIHFTSLTEKRNDDLISCPECNEDFGSENGLKRHTTKYHIHQDRLSDMTDIPLEVTKRKKQDLGNLVTIQGNLNDMEELIDSDTDYDPNQESDSEEEYHETERLLIEEDSVQCNICDSTFRWPSGLRAHTKSMHTGNFKCKKCRWSFASIEKLQEHNEYLHSDDLDCSPVNQKPKCNKCDLSFSTTKKLDQHKDLKHGEQKKQDELDKEADQEDSVKCNICKKEFASIEKLQEHNEYLHMDYYEVNQKPKCNKCDWSFSNTNKLDQHEDLIHGEKNKQDNLVEEAEKDDSWKCSICKKEFSQSSNLDRHIVNIHQKNDRKRKHEDTQHLNNPLQCHYCQKTFTKKFNLQRHNRIHI